MKYYRPETLEEALGLLDDGLPLAGGTALTPRRHELEAVVDLAGLDLGGIQIGEDMLEIGAGARLQELLSSGDAMPEALLAACRQEAQWNLRNQMTVGGALVTADARSPLLTVLLALGASVQIEPGAEDIALEPFLESRAARETPFLITAVRLPKVERSTYAQVARAPADFPLVSAAAGLWQGKDGQTAGVAIGGFGSAPLGVQIPVAKGEAAEAVTSAVAWAQQAYGAAEDVFASGEYRAEVAGVLVERALQEVLR